MRMPGPHELLVSPVTVPQMAAIAGFPVTPSLVALAEIALDVDPDPSEVEIWGLDIGTGRIELEIGRGVGMAQRLFPGQIIEGSDARPVYEEGVLGDDNVSAELVQLAKADKQEEFFALASCVMEIQRVAECWAGVRAKLRRA